jgi:hypothetical protein
LYSAPRWQCHIYTATGRATSQLCISWCDDSGYLQVEL